MISGSMSGQWPTTPPTGSKGFVVIIDIANTTHVLRNEIAYALQSIRHSPEQGDIIQTVKECVVKAVVSFLQANKSDSGPYNELIQQALDILDYYGVPLQVGCNIVHSAEMMIMRNMVEYFPNIDDTDHIRIEKFKFLADGNLCLFVAIIQ